MPQLMNELKRNKSVDSQMPLVLADLMHLLRNLRTPQSLVITRYSLAPQFPLFGGRGISRHL